jgi:hypothetical protein
MTLVTLVLMSVLLATPGAPLQAPTPAGADAGSLHVSFLFMPPTSVEPTYHTAMWLEDAKGQIVRTLYVSQELSNGEYKLGVACPDWVKQAHWEKAPKPQVDAVTAPTPNVGSASMSFNLAELGVKPGAYRFKFQVHITDEHNVLYHGPVVVGGANATLTLDTAVGPGKVTTTDQFVRDVHVQYTAAKK